MVNYKNYNVWKKSHELVIYIYNTTKNFPKSEQYNLTSQMNRACISIPINIAEGCGSKTEKELVRFLYFSSGSAHELDYLILIFKDLGFVDKKQAELLSNEINEIKRMLASLIKTIKKSIA